MAKKPAGQQPTIDQQIAGLVQFLQSGGAGALAEKPIGVPEGFVAEREEQLGLDPRGRAIQGPRRVSTVEPRYFEGDEFAPANLGDEERARLQMALRDLGLIPKGTKFQRGAWDAPTRAAYETLLGYANQWGMSDRQAMAEYARLLDTYGEAIEPAEPLVIRQTNPEDLRSSLAQVARRVYGKGAKPDLVERLVGEWQRYEAEQQTFEHQLAGQIDEGTAPDSTTITEQPSFDVWAESRLRAADPESAAGHSLVGAQSAFFNLLDQTSGADEFSG